MSDLLKRRIARNPPTTQREACRLAARHSIAVLGPCTLGDVPPVAKGLAVGLFGPAFDEADDAQRQTWIDMMAEEYRSAANL